MLCVWALQNRAGSSEHRTLVYRCLVKIIFTFITVWVRACGLGCGMALARMAGASCEVSGRILFSDKLPDLVFFNGIGCKNQLTDVVTCEPCRKDICMRAAARAGAAAEEAPLERPPTEHGVPAFIYISIPSTWAPL